MSCQLLLLLTLTSTLVVGQYDEPHESVTMSEEKRLIKKLLHDYEKVGLIGRPVRNTSDTINVYYGLGLIQILDLDEKNQVLTTNVWNTFKWNDTLLQWKKEDFGDVDEIRIPSTKIWTPDVVLYNYADDRVSEQREALAVVSSNGEVLWIPMSVYKSTCDINIQNFPFDEQTCRMKFGSWTYDGFKLNLNFVEFKADIENKSYENSKEWDLVDRVAKRNSINYTCCPEPYLDLTYCLRIKRISPYYMFVLIIPCILLSLLTLTIFWLPPEAPPKTLLAMSCFVSFFLLLRILANNIPRGSQTVPLIGIFFCTNMVMITVSSFMAITVIHISHRVDKINKLPDWVKTVFFDHIARYLRMPNPPGRQQRKRQKQQLQQQQQQQQTIALETGVYRSTTVTSTGHRTNHGYHPPPPPYGIGAIGGGVAVNSQPAARPDMGGPTYSSNNYKESPIISRQETPDRSPVIGRYLESDVKEIRRAFRAFHNRVARMDERARGVHEWRYLGEVLDRIFFIIYFMAVVITLSTIMPWSKVEKGTRFNETHLKLLIDTDQPLNCTDI